MNWIPVIVGDEYEIYNTLKNKYNRGSEQYIIFTTFYLLNPHIGKDREELLILITAANRFQHLVKL